MPHAVFLTSGHSPFDERILHKMACTLRTHDYTVSILASTQVCETSKYGITIRGTRINGMKKIPWFVDACRQLYPDVIICAEITPIVAAHRYRSSCNRSCKIIADITEWYPEQYVHHLRGIGRHIRFAMLYCYNMLLVNIADLLIIGEEDKARRYRRIAPTKPCYITGYYPVLRYFPCSPPRFPEKAAFVCAMSGILNRGRGIYRMFDLVDALCSRFPDQRFHLLLAGTPGSLQDRLHINQRMQRLNEHTDNAECTLQPWCTYEHFAHSLESADLCFDLRDITPTTTRSLPIKLLDYMAMGKPVLYPRLKAIEREFPDFDAGWLVEDAEVEECVEKVTRYLHQPSLLHRHGRRARQLIEEGRSWEAHAARFVQIISSTLYGPSPS